MPENPHADKLWPGCKHVDVRMLDGIRLQALDPAITTDMLRAILDDCDDDLQRLYLEVCTLLEAAALRAKLKVKVI